MTKINIVYKPDITKVEVFNDRLYKELVKVVEPPVEPDDWEKDWSEIYEQ